MIPVEKSPSLLVLDIKCKFFLFNNNKILNVNKLILVIRWQKIKEAV